MFFVSVRRTASWRGGATGVGHGGGEDSNASEYDRGRRARRLEPSLRRRWNTRGARWAGGRGSLAARVKRSKQSRRPRSRAGGLQHSRADRSSHRTRTRRSRPARRDRGSPTCRPRAVPSAPENGLREGVALAKSTMCGWHKTIAELLRAPDRGDEEGRDRDRAVLVHRRDGTRAHRQSCSSSNASMSLSRPRGGRAGGKTSRVRSSTHSSTGAIGQSTPSSMIRRWRRRLATLGTNARPCTPSCGTAGSRSTTTTAPSESSDASPAVARTGCLPATTTQVR